MMILLKCVTCWRLFYISCRGFLSVSNITSGIFLWAISGQICNVYFWVLCVKSNLIWLLLLFQTNFHWLIWNPYYTYTKKGKAVVLNQTLNLSNYFLICLWNLLRTWNEKQGYWLVHFHLKLNIDSQIIFELKKIEYFSEAKNYWSQQIIRLSSKGLTNPRLNLTSMGLYRKIWLFTMN